MNEYEHLEVFVTRKNYKKIYSREVQNMRADNVYYGGLCLVVFLSQLLFLQIG